MLWTVSIAVVDGNARAEPGLGQQRKRDRAAAETQPEQQQEDNRAAAETRSHSRADAGRTETGRTADTETPTSPAKTRTKGVAPAGGVAGATARYGSGGKSRTPNTVTLPGMNATPDTHRIPRTRVAQPQIVKIFADRSGFVATFPRMTLPINAGGEYKQRQELRTPPAVPTRGLDRLRPSQGQPRALLDVTSARLVTRAECELHDFSAVDACAHFRR